MKLVDLLAIFLALPHLGPPVVPFYPFLGTRIDSKNRNGYPYSNLSTGGPSSFLSRGLLRPFLPLDMMSAPPMLALPGPLRFQVGLLAKMFVLGSPLVLFVFRWAHPCFAAFGGNPALCRSCRWAKKTLLGSPGLANFSFFSVGVPFPFSSVVPSFPFELNQQDVLPFWVFVIPFFNQQA